MRKKDCKLGMDRDITRRDFINGASIAVGGSLLPHQLLAQNSPAQSSAGLLSTRPHRHAWITPRFIRSWTSSARR